MATVRFRLVDWIRDPNNQDIVNASYVARPASQDVVIRTRDVRAVSCCRESVKVTEIWLADYAHLLQVYAELDVVIELLILHGWDTQ